MINLQTHNSVMTSNKNIIIVGGGAGGLELAVKLGASLQNALLEM